MSDGRFTPYRQLGSYSRRKPVDLKCTKQADNFEAGLRIHQKITSKLHVFVYTIIRRTYQGVRGHLYRPLGRVYTEVLD